MIHTLISRATKYRMMKECITTFLIEEKSRIIKFNLKETGMSG